MDNQNQTIDDNMSILIKKIIEELANLRDEDVELTKQLTSFYDNLSQLRQSLTATQIHSTYTSGLIPTASDSLSLTHYVTKPRSDSEPNILSTRQRIITIIDDLQ